MEEMDMNNWSSAHIRKLFLQYFQENGHRVEPSASLIPIDDPSLLWINSGVATLKKYFDGSVVPENPKIVNAQKAIRTNDIENVGFTARHHTFFEMLGNFSIGDYFKKEAIEYAWEFLTGDKWLNLDEDRLYVTVHPEDDEAYDLWIDHMNLPKDHMIRLEENFWDIGEGPSGPNTEIFYDRGPSFGDDPDDPELYPGGENERYLEIWNLVFSQFNHNPDDTYTPLPNKNIDTGMGLERIASIMQGVSNNFETDGFMPIIKATEKLSAVPYGKSNDVDTAYKVISDHIRTVAFAVGDGALPSNEGRGYVLRRLIRRAVRFAKNIGMNDAFMYKLVPVVGEIMRESYPDVQQREEHIAKIVRVEEERFHETLDDGLRILKSIIAKEEQRGSTVFPGEEVFTLYDTYGFPKELTEEYVGEHGFTIDTAGFEKEMEKQRTRAREARKRTDSMTVQTTVLQDVTIESTFVGYTESEVHSKVTHIIKDDTLVSTLKSGEEGVVFLKETPFYAQSGGQVADTGYLTTKEGVRVRVSDVKKAPEGQHMHVVSVEEGTLETDMTVRAIIHEEMRKGIVKNHTATHLLHQALKDVLGDHVNQAGSLVEYDRLRFDFTHFEAVTKEELEAIEKKVNEQIWKSIPLVIEEKSIDEAKDMGAMALFGEKYGDIVRVVQIGSYSIELCGGCHVVNTSEIGLFSIVSETGIGAGTRRIEAVSSKEAYKVLHEKVHTLENVASILKTQPSEAVSKAEQLISDVQLAQRENESLISKLAHIEAGSLIDHVQHIEGISLLATEVQAKDMGQLRNMYDEMKEQMDDGVIVLLAENNGKVQMVAGVAKPLVQKGFHAGKLIKEVASICGGGGGGRPDMAQAGGKDPAKISEALAYVKTYVAQKAHE